MSQERKKLIIKYRCFFQMLYFPILNLVYNLQQHTCLYYIMCLCHGQVKMKESLITFLAAHFTHLCCISGFCGNLNLQPLVTPCFVFFSPHIHHWASEHVLVFNEIFYSNKFWDQYIELAILGQNKSLRNNTCSLSQW